MSSFCNWLSEQFEKSGIENHVTDDRWQKWLDFEQDLPVFERVGERATEFLKSDYIHFLNKVGQLGGTATNARQNPDNINIAFNSRAGTVLGALSKTRNGIKLEFSPRDTVRNYGVDVDKFKDYMQQVNEEGHSVRIDNWSEIKELNSSTAGIAKKAVCLWVGNPIDEEVMGYSKEHFDLLDQFGGKLNQRHENAEQQYAYDVLAEAYKVTENWAYSLQKTVFPNGYIKIRKSPVNQGNHFAEYNWAKIYPEQDSPKELAITVGISAEHLFLKIDTVNASSTLRADYENIRGDYTNSTIVHNKPIEDGLNKNFDELVQWSASYFPRLYDQYNNVAYQLGLMSVKEDRRTYNDTFELSPLNQILYGPPGTGKTYHTIEAAVKAAEPSFVFTGRNELKAKYNELADAKRIRFVTFHQSYGYEEFVEGLRAESDEDKNIYYSIKDGAFKAISDKAAAHKISKPSMINEEARIWQLSIESSGNSKVKTHCLESDIGAIGWGNVGDMSPSKRTMKY